MKYEFNLKNNMNERLVFSSENKHVFQSEEEELSQAQVLVLIPIPQKRITEQEKLSIMGTIENRFSDVRHLIDTELTLRLDDDLENDMPDSQQSDNSDNDGNEGEK